MRHWVSSEFIGFTQLRTDGVHCQEPTSTGLVVLKVVPETGATFLQITMDKKMCASPFPLRHILGALATYNTRNSSGGARCTVKAPGGELRSDFEGGTDGPYDYGREDVG